MDLWEKAINLFGALAFSLSILLTVFFLGIFDHSFYIREFEKYHVQEQLPEYDIYSVHAEVIVFLKNKGDLKNTFFTQRELMHMQDVRSLLGNARLIWLASIIFFFSMCIWYASRQGLSAIRKMMDIGSKILFFSLVALGFFSAISFSLLFDSFHSIFFDADSYLFDPSTEKIVVLYPAGLFSDFFMLLALKITFICILISVCIFLTKKKSAPKKAKNENL